MKTITIGGRQVEGVGGKVASRVGEIERLGEVLGAWAALVDGKHWGLVVANQSGLVIATESQTQQIPWPDFRQMSSDGVSTATQTFGLDFRGVSNEELLSWMAALCSNLGADPTPSADDPDVSIAETSAAPAGSSARAAAVQEALSSYAARPPEWRRDRNRRMTARFGRMGKKYSRAMEGERFASFSLIGTQSWEDYAAATLSAMTLETVSDLDERLEHVEGLLTEIRDLLAKGQE